MEQLKWVVKALSITILYKSLWKYARVFIEKIKKFFGLMTDHSYKSFLLFNSYAQNIANELDAM